MVELTAKSLPVLENVAQALISKQRVPEAWEYQTPLDLAARLASKTEVRVVAASEEAPTSFIAELTAKTESPELSAFIANEWAKATSDNINRLSVLHIEASLDALKKHPICRSRVCPS